MRPYIFLRTAELTEAIDHWIETSESDGYLAAPPESVSVMEEPGRRHGVLIAAGNPRNALALAGIRDEAIAVANTPGGGALVIGVEDTTGQVIGTELDAEYVVGAIPRINVEALERYCCGQRLLCLIISPSRLPLDNSAGVVMWKQQGATQITDRFTWRQQHTDAVEYDPMAQASDQGLPNITPQAMALARSLRPSFRKLSPQLFLRHIGAVHGDGHLSLAGALLLTPAHRVAIEVRADGQTMSPSAELSVLEQLKWVESTLTHVHPEVPYTAYHEALLNGLVHRDWDIAAPTVVAVDNSSLTVLSPGGFHGGVRPDTAVSRHDAKSPALTDLFRELHLLDKQVSGLNRMVYRMIFSGFQPPTLETVTDGEYPVVECRFDSAKRNDAMVELARDIVPADRAFDHRLALVLHYVAQHRTIDVATTQDLLSCSEAAAVEALRAATQTTVRGKPLLRTQDDNVYEFTAL